MIRLVSKLWTVQTTPLAIGRWKHIGMPCEERMRLCASLVWQDYNADSGPQFMKEEKINNKKKPAEEKSESKNTSKPPYDKMTADENAMIACVYG